MRESYAETQIPADGTVDVPYPSWSKIARTMLLYGCEMASGTFEGTGAAIDVATDFDPEMVMIFNIDGLCWAVKTPSMGSGVECIKYVTAGTMSAVAANGITLGTKTFRLGTDGDLNVNLETCVWVAFGSKAGGSAREAHLPASISGVPYASWTEVVRGLGASLTEIFCDAITNSSGAAQNRAMPFDPDFCIVFNDDEPCWAVGHRSLAAGEMLLFDANGVMSYELADGFTFGTKQLTIGANATLNGANDELHIVAFGQGSVGSYAETQIPASIEETAYPTYHQVARKLLAYAAELETGTLTGANPAADETIALPFDPAFVMVFNRTGLAWSMYFPSLAADTAMKAVTNGDVSLIANNGTTIGSKQFLFGLDTDLNVLGEVVHWAAFGGREVSGE